MRFLLKIFERKGNTQEGTGDVASSFLDKYNIDRLVGIDDITRKNVISMLIEGIDKGEGTPKISQRIKSVLEGKDFQYYSQEADEDNQNELYRQIAHTETSRIQNEKHLDRYEKYGCSKVEWFTSGGAVVSACDLCKEMDGKKFSIKDAQGKMPPHQACRCTWGPVIE